MPRSPSETHAAFLGDHLQGVRHRRLDAARRAVARQGLVRLCGNVKGGVLRDRRLQRVVGGNEILHCLAGHRRIALQLQGDGLAGFGLGRQIQCDAVESPSKCCCCCS